MKKKRKRDIYVSICLCAGKCVCEDVLCCVFCVGLKKENSAIRGRKECEYLKKRGRKKEICLCTWSICLFYGISWFGLFRGV